MIWTDEIQQFVTNHLADDTVRLLLSASRFPTIDVPFAVEQIEARRRLRNKLPEWYALPSLIMGGRIPAEQCSSVQTARFKRSVMLPDTRSLCDMTGGMGVDFWYMSKGLDRAIYTERQSSLCEAARHNFSVLSSVASSDLNDVPAAHIEVREGVSTSMPIPDVDVIYLDPARRSTDGSRVYEISDCEPDVVAWQHELLSHCRQLITKVSPMADISRTIGRLESVTDVYVLAVRNECKELLIVQQPDASSSQPRLHCVDFMSSHTVSFSFTDGEQPDIPLAPSVGRYFYEPDVCIHKAQAYRALSASFNVSMFDNDCHYFTSSELCGSFPGRVFEVDEVIPFSSRNLKQLRNRFPQANIAVRNFPLTADELRRRTSIRDGGDLFLFGATLFGQGPLLLCCHKIKC